jgi:hypothetical protein
MRLVAKKHAIRILETNLARCVYIRPSLCNRISPPVMVSRAKTSSKKFSVELLSEDLTTPTRSIKQITKCKKIVSFIPFVFIRRRWTTANLDAKKPQSFAHALRIRTSFLAKLGRCGPTEPQLSSLKCATRRGFSSIPSITGSVHIPAFPLARRWAWELPTAMCALVIGSLRFENASLRI